MFGLFGCTRGESLIDRLDTGLERLEARFSRTSTGQLLIRVLDRIEVGSQKLWRLYLSRRARFSNMCSAVPGLRPSAYSTIVFALVHIVDRCGNYNPALQALYFLPIWVAARLGGISFGTVAVLATAGLLSANRVIMHTGTQVPWGRDFLLWTFSLGLMMLLFVQTEGKLKKSEIRANKDAVTGVLNRAAFDHELNEILLARGPASIDTIVVLADCDNFKRLNDTYGHALGDYALRVLARRLQIAAGDRGIVGRIGGDEFCAVFENSSMALAEEAMKKAAQGYARFFRSLDINATISYGIVAAPSDGEVVSDLLQAADAKMYQAKTVKPPALAVVSNPVAPEPESDVWLSV